MVFNNCRGIEGDVIVANKVDGYTLGELLTRYIKKQEIVISDSNSMNSLESLANSLLSRYYKQTKNNPMPYGDVYTKAFNTFDLIVVLGSKDNVDVREIYYKHERETKCGLGYDNSENRYTIYSGTRIKFITDILHNLKNKSDKNVFIDVVEALTIPNSYCGKVSSGKATKDIALIFEDGVSGIYSKPIIETPCASSAMESLNNINHL